LIWFSFKFLIFMKCFVTFIPSFMFVENFHAWTWKLWRQRDCQGTWK
jgi:hypothetical protein